MSLRSPLGAALGHGSAKDGTHHWWDQRITSLLLVPLGIWFVVSLLRLPDFAHVTVAAWAAQPLNGILLLAFALTTLWHSALGTQVIVEDYVHGRVILVVTLLGLRIAHLLLAVAAGWAILRLSFWGGA